MISVRLLVAFGVVNPAWQQISVRSMFDTSSIMPFRDSWLWSTLLAVYKMRHENNFKKYNLASKIQYGIRPIFLGSALIHHVSIFCQYWKIRTGWTEFEHYLIRIVQNTDMDKWNVRTYTDHCILTCAKCTKDICRFILWVKCLATGSKKITLKTSWTIFR